MIDRRVQKTRQALHHALISLILEKGYETVTVQDVLDKANVGRSTFYAHFTGKEDLLKAGLTELGRMLREHQHKALSATGDASERCFGFVLPLFEHARDHTDVYRAIVGKRSGAVVMARLREVLVELVRDDLKALAPKDATDGMPRGAIIQYVEGSLMAVLTWWVEQKQRVSAAEAEQIFRRLALPGLIACNIFEIS